MSEIKVGDLVVVVRNCCSDEGLGIILTVENIEPAIDLRFNYCGHYYTDGSLIQGTYKGMKGYHLAAWVKRIPPLAELEVTERTTELVV